MKRKKVIRTGLAVSLLITVLLTGCGSNDSRNNNAEASANETIAVNETAATNETTVEQDQANSETDSLAQELMKKYSAGAGEYDGNVIKVDRDESVVLEIGYNPWDNDVAVEESFVVYQDADLQFPIEVGSYEYDADAGTLMIEPPYYGVAEMDSSELDLSHLSGNYFTQTDENGWGTLSQYYLVSYVDVQTGEKLSKPFITVLKVNAEISTAPQMVFDPTEDGYARFTWQEVPEAEGYLLFKINKDETGFWDNASVFADVKGTEWSCKEEDVISDYDGKILTANYRFQQYFMSDDSQSWIEENAAELLTDDEDMAYDEFWSEYYGVIAYNGEGCSPVSNLMSAKDLAHMLPTEPAGHANDETFFEISGTQGLPAVMSVTMCDGSTAQKVIDYDFDSIVKNEEDQFFVIWARGTQTPFTEEIHAYDVNWDTFDADIEAVKQRQEKLKNKGGNVAPSLTVDEDVQVQEGSEEAEPEETAEPEKPEKENEGNAPGSSNIKKIEVQVTANSAMSEYIARHMLETEAAIDLSAFPESADTEKIVDAFFEAQYQNPLVLGVQGGSIDTENRTLYVEYDFDKEVTSQKQEEIKQKVSEIVDEIITADMSDAQKGLAINTWLCENAIYDNDALANAELYSFTRVDEEFYDSFTAYGILMDGVGVCASYSAAYKLLADAAGLDSIVVTGYLDGSVPHAWNKVQLDEEWYIVDSTNNDNDVIQNALLNLSDEGAGSTLVEDDRFAMNDSVFTYAAKKEAEEYYRVTDRYFEKEEIAEKLADLLKENGEAVLRTEHDIDDEAFYEIAQDAANKANKSINGFYWMGVINLQE